MTSDLSPADEVEVQSYLAGDYKRLKPAPRPAPAERLPTALEAAEQAVRDGY